MSDVTIPLAVANDACAALEAVAYDPREPERYRDRYRASLAALRHAMTEAAATHGPVERQGVEQ